MSPDHGPCGVPGCPGRARPHDPLCELHAAASVAAAFRTVAARARRLECIERLRAAGYPLPAEP